MTRLQFPGIAEDLDDAFGNALDQGVMDRDSQSRIFWGRFEFLASDVDDDEVVQADWFLNEISNVYTRVPRKDNST